MTDENMPPFKSAGNPGEKPAELSGILLDEQSVLTLVEISSACAVQAGYVIELVEEGLITPVSPETGQEISPQVPREAQSWRFTGVHMRLVRIASRLQGDLGVNLAGVALALQLLDEVETLRTRLR
ncbi:MAG: chaperone modulator CbpM [Nitrosospira sp.]